MVIQTDYSTPAAALGRRAHSHRAALTLAAFLVDKVGQSHSSYGDDSLDALQNVHGEWWSPCIYRRNRNDSSPLSLRLWLCRTFRRHSEGASARKGGTLAASYFRARALCAEPVRRSRFCNARCACISCRATHSRDALLTLRCPALRDHCVALLLPCANFPVLQP